MGTSECLALGLSASAIQVLLSDLDDSGDTGTSPDIGFGPSPSRTAPTTPSAPSISPKTLKNGTTASLPENSCLFITGKRCVFGDNGQLIENEDICCGEYEDEGRRYLQKDHGGQFACCAHDTGDGLAHAHDDHLHTSGDPKLNGFPWNGNLYNVLTHCCPHGKPIP